jgi:hypothetical protein
MFFMSLIGTRKIGEYVSRLLSQKSLKQVKHIKYDPMTFLKKIHRYSKMLIKSKLKYEYIHIFCLYVPAFTSKGVLDDQWSG